MPFALHENMGVLYVDANLRVLLHRPKHVESLPSAAFYEEKLAATPSELEHTKDGD